MNYRGLVLDRFQEQAITALEEGRSVLVSAPTGTGKTVIADWIVEASLAAGHDVIYTAPVKALSNQKFRDYCRLLGEENVGLVTGDLVIRRDAPCRVMTTEILRNMLLADDGLDKLGAVVLDEVHFLDDRERGTVWEEVLIYLPREVQVVGLSATLPNLDDLAAWMREVRQREVDVVTEDRRAVPLQFHLASAATGLVDAEKAVAKVRRRKRRPPRGRARGPKPSNRGSTHLDMFRIMVDEELLPYLYFTFSRKNTEMFARRLVRKLGGDSLLTPEERAELDARVDALAPSLGNALDDELRAVYRAGVAFHHAGLHVQLKLLVEELYEARLIKVLYCTSTFALGVNMPARSAVFDELQKFDGHEVRPLTVRQFMQKAGRAGRRGMDDVGHVVIRLDPDMVDEHAASIRRYLGGAYEPVRSSFNLSFNSVVSLLSRFDAATCRELVYRSFLAWHLDKQAAAARQEIERLEERGASGRELRKLRRSADRTADRCWTEFERKVELLKRIGYLGDDGFAAGARVLQHVQISEVFVTELVLGGLLDHLDDGTLFGLLCAVTSELPRGVTRHFPIPRDDLRLVRAVERVLRDGPVEAADNLAGTNTSFGVDMLPLGRMWHDGDSLDDLMSRLSSRTDVSGSVIAAFRRAKDLVGQLRGAYAAAGMREHEAQLSRINKAVSRDEVEVVA